MVLTCSRVRLALNVELCCTEHFRVTNLRFRDVDSPMMACPINPSVSKKVGTDFLPCPSISRCHCRWVFKNSWFGKTFWYEILRIHPLILSQRQNVSFIKPLCLTWPSVQGGQTLMLRRPTFMVTNTCSARLSLRPDNINRDWFKCNCFKMITQFSFISISTFSTCGSSSVASVLTPGAMTRIRVFSVLCLPRVPPRFLERQTLTQWFRFWQFRHTDPYGGTSLWDVKIFESTIKALLCLVVALISLPSEYAYPPFFNCCFCNPTLPLVIGWLRTSLQYR